LAAPAYGYGLSLAVRAIPRHAGASNPRRAHHGRQYRDQHPLPTLAAYNADIINILTAYYNVA